MDDVLAEARQQLRSDPQTIAGLVPQFSRAGDTATLRTLTEILTELEAGAVAANPRGAVLRQAPLARAGWLLARGDTAAAVDSLLAPSLASCRYVPCSGYLLAELLVATDRDADAARVLDRWLPSLHTSPLYPLGALLRGAGGRAPRRSRAGRRDVRGGDCALVAWRRDGTPHSR